MLKIRRVTPPAAEPIGLADVKPQLKLEPDDATFDDDINQLIPPAREWVEDYLNRSLITQVWERILDNWPDDCQDDPIWSGREFIKLPRPPLQSVDSFRFTDAEGTTTVWGTTEYIVDEFSEPGQVVPVNGWPRAQLQKINGIAIRYAAGYGDTPETVPARIRQALTMLVAYWVENGQCDPPSGVYNLLDPERVKPI